MTKTPLTLFVAATMASLSLTTTVAAEPDTALIQKPDWVQTPSTDDFVRAYPPLARAQGVSGRATIRCAIKADGTIHRCKILSEEPAGKGFGKAALKLAPRFRMTGTKADGGSLEGGVIMIPIRFRY